MNFFERTIARLSPRMALSRARNRAALDVMMRYEAATPGNRGKSWRPVMGDADAVAAASRQRLAGVARDMIRNTPFATRAQQVITNNVVGAGIIPKIKADKPADKEKLLRAIEAHCDTTAIDVFGRANLYGLQRLAINAVIDGGEALIRRRRLDRSAGFTLPFQIEVLEGDHLDRAMHGRLSNGNECDEGIEYDAAGRAVAYWLYPKHPGSLIWSISQKSERVPAEDVLHIYRQDRPGQRRGVSWFAPIALTLQDMADHQDAQLMRQKIAACFSAFRVTIESPDMNAATNADGSSAATMGSLTPGRIQDLPPGEDIRFGTPPAAEGYDEFTRNVLRSVAAGLGVTYEALTGDLSNVNFSSARMGRMEMDRNVDAWQWVMLIPQMCQPIGQWIVEGWQLMQMRRVAGVSIGWVPPRRALVDPTKEIPALIREVRAGFNSKQNVVRSLGFDPERVIEENAADAKAADEAKLVFDTDPRRTSNAGLTQARPDGTTFQDEEI